jgi:hypothetical protein
MDKMFAMVYFTQSWPRQNKGLHRSPDLERERKSGRRFEGTQNYWYSVVYYVRF